MLLCDYDPQPVCPVLRFRHPLIKLCVSPLWGELVATRDTIVIGASAGGVQALSKLVAELPPDLPAAVFIVLHIPSCAPSFNCLLSEEKADIAEPALQT